MVFHSTSGGSCIRVSSRFVAVAVIVLLQHGSVAAQQLQDVVSLDNGGVVRGTIIEQLAGDRLKIQTPDGSVFVYGMDAIRKMTGEPVAGSVVRMSRRAEEYPLSAEGTDSTDPGIIEIGGSGSFTRGVYVSDGVAGESATTSIGISPAVSVFITDGLSLGVNPVSLSYHSYGNAAVCLRRGCPGGIRDPAGSRPCSRSVKPAPVLGRLL